MPARCPRFLPTIALSVLSLAAVHKAAAQQSDLNTILLSRLKGTAAYTLPGGYTLASVQLKGSVVTDGIRFQLPSVIPQRAQVLMTSRISNCGSLAATARAEVNQTTTNSESFTKETMLGGSTSVSVSYKSPIGLNADVTQSFNYSNTNSEQTGASESVRWTAGIDVPIPPNSQQIVQFVVAEQRLERVPWSTNASVSGPVELSYTRPLTPVTLCVYENKQAQGMKKCWTTTTPIRVPNFKQVSWGNMPVHAPINDQITSFTISGAASVVFFNDSEYRGSSMKYRSSRDRVGDARNDTYSSMILEPEPPTEKRTQNLEDLLGADARKIALSGSYRGTIGVLGDFRAGAPVALSASDCQIVSPSISPTAVSPTNDGPTAGPLRATAPRVTKSAISNSAPLQGQILQQGIRPASRSGNR